MTPVHRDSRFGGLPENGTNSELSGLRREWHCSLAAVALLIVSIGSETRAAEAYAQRGDQIELRYEKYTAELQAVYKELRRIVADAAPRLLPRLEPPERQRYGYQILPQISVDSDVVCNSADEMRQRVRHRPRSNRFSWQITQARIERELAQLNQRLASRLGQLQQSSAPQRLLLIEQAVDEYLRLKKAHRAVDRLIQHNWLWQKEVARRKPRYDRATQLHDAIVEREVLQSALEAKTDAEFRQTLQSTRYSESRQSRAELESDLKLQVAVLSQRIKKAARGLTPKDYVEPIRRKADLLLIEVPVYTDIEDQSFLRQLAEAIESRWCLDDGVHRFRIKLSFVPIATETLYANDQNDEPIPGHGASIDLLTHCKRFPEDGARLTSGANKTYVLGGCLFLGPAKVGSNTLAHEFGHLLGFADEYVRGYRDLGANGYEILEILPDNADLMASTRHGRVHRYHFDALIAGSFYRQYYQQGFAAIAAENYAAATRLFRQAVAASYSETMAADAYNNLGWSLAKLERYREAEVAYESALRARPDYQLARNNLELLRSLKKGLD